MNKEYRRIVNVRVAFSSAAKNAFLTAGVTTPRRTRSTSKRWGAVLQSRLSRYCARYLRPQFPRRASRWLAKRFYRALKPLIMPLAFRVRRYLLAELNDQSQANPVAAIEALQQVCQNLMQETQHIRSVLAQTQLATPAASVFPELQTQLERFAQSHKSDWQHFSENLKARFDGHADAALKKIQSDQQATAWDTALWENRYQELQEHLASITTDWASRLNRIESYAYASARRVAISCEPGEVMVKAQVGYVMCPTNDPAVLVCLIEAGELEPGTRQLIQRLLQPGDTFIDVGANLGLHTIAAGRAMQGRGCIIAFEPYEPTWRLLQKSIWINGFAEITQIHQAAVSNKTGQQLFFLGATSGHHSLYGVQGPDALLPPPVEVNLAKLDDVVQQQRVTLIKIDVEGAELDVVRGAQELLRANPDLGLIVEFGPSHLQHAGHTSAEWFKVFNELGFIHRRIDAQTGALDEASVEILEAAVSTNLFFARATSPLWARAEISS